MAIFTSPTVAEVLTEVKLRPEQVRASFSQTDFESDVESRIVTETAYCDNRARAKFGITSSATLTDEETTLGEQWILLRVAASVYHTAGQGGKSYRDEANDYERRAKELEEAILGSIDSRTASVTSSTYSYALARRDGYSASGSEYASD